MIFESESDIINAKNILKFMFSRQTDDYEFVFTIYSLLKIIHVLIGLVDNELY